MTSKRHFIAGARCPACDQLDKIQRVQDNDTLWMECVACGMKKSLDDEPAETSKQNAVDQIVRQVVEIAQPVKK